MISSESDLLQLRNVIIITNYSLSNLLNHLKLTKQKMESLRKHNIVSSIVDISWLSESLQFGKSLSFDGYTLEETENQPQQKSQENVDSSTKYTQSDGIPPLCIHNKPAALRKVQKEGENHGKLFYCCQTTNWPNRRCNFFQWFDVADNSAPPETALTTKSTSTPTSTSTSTPTSTSTLVSSSSDAIPPLCIHNKPAALRKVQKEG